MTVLPLVMYGDPRLRTKPPKVTSFDNGFNLMVDHMLDSMAFYGGVGLASTQIGWDRRVAIFFEEQPDNPKKQYDVIVAANLEVIDAYGHYAPEEGCLSVPGTNGMRRRPKWISARWQDRDGNVVEQEAEDFFAQVISHECDHLDGRMFVDPDRREWPVDGMHL